MKRQNVKTSKRQNDWAPIAAHRFDVLTFGRFDVYPRGLTLMELLLALAITAMVAAAVASMLGAVTSGVGARRDSRTAMVLASAAASRLSAYVAPSRCVLDASSTTFVLWLHDDRQSDTVHASEVRWFIFDSVTGALDVCYVQFPSGWTQAAQDLEDSEYPASADWMAVLASYRAKGWIASQALLDQLVAVEFTLDHVDPMLARQVSARLDIASQDGSAPVVVASAIRIHHPPNS